jgi:hypothetical protein
MPIILVNHFGLVWFLFGLGQALGVINVIVYARMIAQINRKASDEKRVSFWFDYPGKAFKVRRYYRELYPEDRLYVLWDVSSIGVMLCFFMIIWQLGAFDRVGSQ